MTKLFKKLFIKDYQDVSNPKVRARYGVASGALGIISNVVLFILKLIGGLLSGSIAVIADAINNLSDFMTSIITLIGFKMAGQPADKEHPYGHARFEYVTGLIVACVIFFIGIETGRAAIEKIIAGSITQFSIITCIILGVSVIVKVLISIIFNGLGKSICSDALKAMSADSRNDAISSFVILTCAIVAILTGVSLDGYLGVAVSVLVIISAITLIKDTINPLVGTAPDKELIEKIETKLKSYPEVLDIHDLIVHSYGATKTFATVHIEVDASVDVMLSHDLVDNIERDFFNDMHVTLVGHLDPVNVNDAETVELKNALTQTLKDYNDALTLHDFRIVCGKTHTNVIFDVVIPFGTKNIENDIRRVINEKLCSYDKKYYAVIEFDKSYNG